MLKRLLLVLSLAVPAFAGGPLQTQRYFKNTGGLFNHISPLLTPDSTANSINNITMDDRGQLSKRNGYTVVQSTYAMVGFSTWSVTGGGYHTATSGNSFFAVTVGSSVYKTGNTYSTWSNVTGSVALTANVTNLAQKTDLNDNIIFCNDLDKPFYLASTGNATQISTNTFTAAKTCASYGTYLIVANTTESAVSYPSRVRWSDINNINSFPALNYIDVEPDNGDKIVGIVAFEDSVYIFKQYSIYRMLITGLSGADAFIIRPVSRNIGAWAKNSIKVIPNVGIAFLAQNTAYMLSDSGLTPIGDPIQRTFDSITRSMWTQAVAEVYPRRYQYWLAVSTSGTTNATTLVYDYVQQNWTMYTGMNISMLAQGQDSTGQSVLLSGDYKATVYKQDNGTSDNPHGTATAVQASYVTNDLLLGTPEYTKGIKYVYIYSIGDSNYTLGVNAAYDFNANYEYTKNVSLGSTAAVYDTGVYGTDIYPAVGYQVTRLELNRSARAIRLKFTNNNLNEAFGLLGWVVVYQIEDLKQ